MGHDQIRAELCSKHKKITDHSQKEETNNGPLHCKYIIKCLSFVVAGVSKTLIGFQCLLPQICTKSMLLFL